MSLIEAMLASKVKGVSVRVVYMSRETCKKKIKQHFENIILEK